MLWISRSQPNTRGLCGADCSLNVFRWAPVVISRSGT
jgi:hypothetical protein